VRAQDRNRRAVDAQLGSGAESWSTSMGKLATCVRSFPRGSNGYRPPRPFGQVYPAETVYSPNVGRLYSFEKHVVEWILHP